MKKLYTIFTTLLFLFSFTSASLAESYVMHTAKEGDTYWKLSEAYRKDASDLLSMNQKSDIDLNAGDFVKVHSIQKDIEIYVNGNKISPDSSPYMENNRTFVPIRFVAEALNGTVEWEGWTSSAVIKVDNKTITLPVNSKTVYVDDKSYSIDAPARLYKDRVFIPLRFVSEMLNCSVEWDQKNYTAIIQTDAKQNIAAAPEKSYSDEDLYWLSRIVSAEASGEPYEGKLAVANVVINRTKNKEFPNTIKGVIFDKKFGYQFTPVADGSIYKNPTNDSIQAAKEALSGVNNIGNALYFVNPRKSTLSWIQNNRRFYKTLNNHNFYV